MVDDILCVTKCNSTVQALSTALKMNSTVNTFVETKKMKLSKSKCSVRKTFRTMSKVKSTRATNAPGSKPHLPRRYCS